MARPRKRANHLDGRTWTRYSVSVWSDIRKTPEELALKHPATFPAALVKRLIECFAAPGDRVVLEGDDPSGPAPSQQIDVDAFFSMPMRVEDSVARVGDVALFCAGRSVRTAKVAKGRVQ